MNNVFCHQSNSIVARFCSDAEDFGVDSKEPWEQGGIEDEGSIANFVVVFLRYHRYSLSLSLHTYSHWRGFSQGREVVRQLFVIIVVVVVYTQWPKIKGGGVTKILFCVPFI